MAKSLKDLFDSGCRQLKGLPSPVLDTKILLLYAAAISEETFLAHPEMKIRSELEKRFLNYLRQRNKGIPVAYITGEKEFWSMPFQVSRGVLVPRPETEILVEAAVDAAITPSPKILEIGTGSGNIAVSLAREVSRAVIFAMDISLSALRLAKANAAALGAGNIHFFQGNLFEPLKPGGPSGIFDLVVSNPPYLSEEDWARADTGIREFEPKAALVSSPNGLEIIAKIIDRAPDYLQPEGYLLLEVGFGQAETAAGFFGEKWKDIRVRKDLAGIPRVISARRLS